MHERIFLDRADAGRQLAVLLERFRADKAAIVLALPRGGVPVAHEVARLLSLPLDIFLVRKLGAPGFEELAIGAIASGGIRVVNEDVVRQLRITEADIDRAVAHETRELERREREYRGSRPPLDVAGRTTVLIDDGFATGASMRAAIAALRLKNAARVVAAVPVGAPQSCEELEQLADEVVCAIKPVGFESVSQWYRVFDQTSDEEVRSLLEGGPI
jgi:predicted phosphoribosyltransferase